MLMWGELVLHAKPSKTDFLASSPSSLSPNLLSYVAGATITLQHRAGTVSTMVTLVWMRRDISIVRMISR